MQKIKVIAIIIGIFLPKVSDLLLARNKQTC
jgi:hypothetical protein